MKISMRSWSKSAMIFLCVACIGHSQFTTEPTTLKPVQELRLELESHGIIPDCLNSTPPFGVKIKFLEKIGADYGTILKPEMAKFAPYLIKWPVKNDTFYTVIMIGLDEPSRESPSLREWLHYLVVNIPGPTVFQGEILARWVQPLPEMGSAAQNPNITVKKIILPKETCVIFSIRSDKDRAHFSHQRFADKYEMGIPLAVNFFQCTGPFNASVPTVSSAEIEVPDFNFYDVAKVEEKTKKEAEMNKEKEDKRNQEIPEHFSLVPPE